MSNGINMFAGQSGVGKSSLLNQLIPDAAAATKATATAAINNPDGFFFSESTPGPVRLPDSDSSFNSSSS